MESALLDWTYQLHFRISALKKFGNFFSVPTSPTARIYSPLAMVLRSLSSNKEGGMEKVRKNWKYERLNRLKLGRQSGWQGRQEQKELTSVDKQKRVNQHLWTNLGDSSVTQQKGVHHFTGSDRTSQNVSRLRKNEGGKKNGKKR